MALSKERSVRRLELRACLLECAARSIVAHAEHCVTWLKPSLQDKEDLLCEVRRLTAEFSGRARDTQIRAAQKRRMGIGPKSAKR